MTAPWRSVHCLEPAAAAALRRRAIFDCCKWDPQVGDVSTIADFPIVLAADQWRQIVVLAEALAREIAAMEDELRERRELHRALALPWSVRRMLSGAVDRPAAGFARLVRFDFHHTAAGWRVSEANTDVPGGLNEASGLPPLVAPFYDATVPAGDPAGEYVRILARGAREHARLALVHATAYTDDRQVMTYLGRRLEQQGVAALLVSPSHLHWSGGRATMDVGSAAAPIDGVVRFFPGEWLPNLPRSSGWRHFAAGAATPISNPATALLTQSKRLPLVWDRLRTPRPTWQALLPETRDPRDAPWAASDEWVVKPALGRVGEGVGVRGVTSAAQWSAIRRDIAWHPRGWVAQRRFEATPMLVDGRALHPCVGVYTIDGTVAGAYGRVAEKPLIDAEARDAAVLVEQGGVRRGGVAA